jgi:hypothetical protein
MEVAFQDTRRRAILTAVMTASDLDPQLNLEGRCNAFLRMLPASQDLDQVVLQTKSTRADFYLPDRNMLIEIKNISKAGVFGPPSYAQRLKYSRRRLVMREYSLIGLGKVGGLWDSRHVLDQTRAVESGLRKANEQIRSSRQLLSREGAEGVVIFVCENANLLPEDITGRYEHVQNSRQREGIPVRYPSVPGCIVAWKSNKRATRVSPTGRGRGARSRRHRGRSQRRLKCQRDNISVMRYRDG